MPQRIKLAAATLLFGAGALALVPVIVAMISSCGDDHHTPIDASCHSDAPRPPDAAAPDATVDATVDASTPVDAAPPDATVDAGQVDAGQGGDPDAGSRCTVTAPDACPVGQGCYWIPAQQAGL